MNDKTAASRRTLDRAFALDVNCATPEVVPAGIVAVVMLITCGLMIVALIRPIVNAIGGR